ncbi:STAGA complex 65 subunit gamma isoform X2 [Lampetra fluviatilis]
MPSRWKNNGNNERQNSRDKMMRYWGEIPVSPSQSLRSAVELLQPEPRAAEVREPAMLQPCAVSPARTTDSRVPGLHVTHTIRLLQYNRRLRGLISSAQQQQQGAGEVVKSEEVEPLPPLPSPPPLPEELASMGTELGSSNLGGSTLRMRLRDPDMETGDFYRGCGEPVMEVSSAENRQLLHRAVVTALAHAGFDTAMESTLETLTDITHEFMLKLTKLLRVTVDREAQTGQTGFPDAIEQVFQETGLGSVLDLQEFWQERVVDYHAYVLSASRHLAEEYERLLNPERVLSTMLRVKEEPLGEQISFPVSEESETEQTATDQQPLQLEIEGPEQSSSNAGTDSGGDVSPIWSLVQVKAEPQESDEPPPGMLVGCEGAFDEPMSALSEGGIALTPNTTASDGSHLCPTPDSIATASPPMFGQRQRKKFKKM